MNKKYFILTLFIVFLTYTSPLLVELPKFCLVKDGMIDCRCLWASLSPFSEQSFFLFRFLLILVIVLVSFVMHYFQIYKPIKRMESVRKNVFDIILAPNISQWITNGYSIRINIMKVSRPLRYLGLAHKLVPIYHYGFDGFHDDGHLIFWVWRIFKKATGNCGLALLLRDSQFANLTVDEPAQYGLNEEEIAKTSYIKGIISIPVFQEFNTERKSEVIGVINIDTNEESLAKEWAIDQTCRDAVISNFTIHAQIVSYFI